MIIFITVVHDQTSCKENKVKNSVNLDLHITKHTFVLLEKDFAFIFSDNLTEKYFNKVKERILIQIFLRLQKMFKLIFFYIKTLAEFNIELNLLGVILSLGH